MWSPRTGSRSLGRRDGGRGLACAAALAMGTALLSTGCQVEYAGMTLPSGKYMHDDVQYFPPGPDFPWANTQAATQRARMQAMGMEVPGPGQGGPLTVTPPPGAMPPSQNRMGRPTDINASPLSVEPPPGPAPAAPAPGVVPAVPEGIPRPPVPPDAGGPQ